MRRIAAIYTQKTMSLVRRVLAPYSVLAQRGYPFSFLAVDRLSSGIAYGYDATVLPNWRFSDESELSILEETIRHGRAVLYDLCDLSLLQDERVRQALRICQLVTVKSEYAQREVRYVVGTQARVAVLPSTLDPQYFVQARRLPPPLAVSKDALVIGCFGSEHDWSMVRKPLAALCQKSGRVIVLADAFAGEALKEEKRIRLFVVECTPDVYPQLLLQCDMGVCPVDASSGGDSAYDPISLLEWGILCKPVVASLTSTTASLPALHATSEEIWLERFKEILFTKKPVEQVHALFEAANRRRATKVADQYLRTIEKMLPLSVSLM